ncbi:Uncharacterised protein [Legionella busanensis]|uniref:Uncharacterized protein n=1 Tax=Legionella busanensis TaxID=190655 RepID=A0A378JJD0_9GAMM|nr:hypothetical protein [Legionella busanensis]STX50423.1 Uncharacterised protein [Legionella busanensis]
MFYHQYLTYRSRWQKIIKKYEQKISVENATVTIQDLVAYPLNKKESFGESKNSKNPYRNLDSLPRLIDHISNFFQMANLYHEHAYCEFLPKIGYQLKQDCLNKITRFSLPEFSLYSQNPLTLAQFTSILEEIEALAYSIHENVHLLLSSFSVISNQGENLNVVLYVQGGQPPKIDTIVKGFASKIDITYPNATNFSQQKNIDFDTAQRKSVSAYTGGENVSEGLISNNSILEIETRGGARFIQAIDICLDHAYLHSKKLLLAQLNRTIDYTHSMPEQADHILTSNSIDPERAAKISPSIFHIDPDPTTFDKDNRERLINEDNFLKPATIEPISHYPKMQILNKDNGIHVINPPFGSDYRVVAYQERKLGGFAKDLDNKIKALNKHIRAKQIYNLLPPYGSLQEFLSIENNRQKVSNATSMLLNTLTKKCKPNLFEYFFKTNNFYIKKEVKAILDDSAITLRDLKIQNAETLVNTHIWSKDVKFKLSLINNGFPNSFIKEITNAIDTLQKDFALPPEWANELTF